MGSLKSPGVVKVTGIALFLVIVLSSLLHFREFKFADGSRHEQEKIKVMIVGDSISQGSEGDYTWRYRLWEWFRENAVVVDFVGPYNGTNIPRDVTFSETGGGIGLPDDALPRTRPDSGGYALDVSPDFDSDHFAIWGRQVYQDKSAIAEEVRKYDPDYLLVELGYNDLAWFFGPEDCLKNMRELVENARSVKPALKFLIANIPGRPVMKGGEDVPEKTMQYNGYLAIATHFWDSEESPVELVDVAGTYSCSTHGCPSGHDDLHPNAMGEYQIAQAFSSGLQERYRIGKRPLAVPKDIPERPCPKPLHLSASATNVTWDAIYGAYNYEVQSHVTDKSGKSSWPELSMPAITNHTGVPWTPVGKGWELRVRTNCGNTMKSEWSEVLSSTQINGQR